MIAPFWGPAFNVRSNVSLSVSPHVKNERLRKSDVPKSSSFLAFRSLSAFLRLYGCRLPAVFVSQFHTTIVIRHDGLGKGPE